MAVPDVTGTPGAGFRSSVQPNLGKPSSDLMGGLRLSQLTKNRSLPHSIFDSNPLPLVQTAVKTSSVVNTAKVTGYRAVGKVLNRLNGR